jgi:ABC-type nitrate/sulfonate/bicarbonate transport system ATPase subunit
MSEMSPPTVVSPTETAGGEQPPVSVGEHLDQLNATNQNVAPAIQHIVEMTNVNKCFVDGRKGERVEVLKDFAFTIEPEAAGSFVVLLGPSGCGKSTVLGLLSGLSLADSGEVKIYGELVTGPSPHSATVLQAYTCFPWLTVVENVEFGLMLIGTKKSERRERAMEYLRKVDLVDRYKAYPKQLSGGMQQRVAIARTLAIKPPIVLMDEPFGALDAQTRTEMQQMVLELWDEEKNTIVFVTHDISEALLLGDRVIVFPTRPIFGNDFYERRNLDQILGHKRPPELTREPRFMELCEELRQRLKRPERKKH